VGAPVRFFEDETELDGKLTWMAILLVATGGALGALARFGLAHWASERLGDGFPSGTLVVNVIGCLIIGVLMAFSLGRAGFPERTRLFLAVGFLGSLTTFSTLGYETIALVEARAYARALLSVGANLVLGLGAVATGLFIGNRWP